MVIVRRHQFCVNENDSTVGSQLPMGNDESLLHCFNSNSRTRSSLFPEFSISRWTLRLVYLVTFFSWLSAFRFKSNMTRLSADFEMKINKLILQKEQTLKLIDDAKNSRSSILSQIRKQQRIKRLFEHEARMSKELYEKKQNSPSSDISELVERRQNGITSNWVQQRQETLQNKLFGLQSIVKEQSRKQIIAKYGPGPHIIEIEVLTGPNSRTPGRLVVELASIDYMPYSVLEFLDMVTKKLWDNTVLYHHSSQHHVVAAAPVNFGTFDNKNHHFAALGHKGISFPEYSDTFPHSKYTLGFSGTGPNFYINTIDNTKHHGPGGQGHHELPQDADPCFGKIIAGHDVIKHMMPARSKKQNPKTWEDFDLTRIVRIKIVN